MRDSDYRSITNNRAAVTITTSLYDRRALDVTADKPLVNSLNHLTYLVSSSAKVRDTLSNDGGIERLVEILHECHNTTFNVADTIFNSETKLLTAWKWTLAFQCLVLVGTRGTEKIRQKVVRAGMLPIIATVLDNYMTLHEGSFVALLSAVVQDPLLCLHQHQANYINAFADDAQGAMFMNIRNDTTPAPTAPPQAPAATLPAPTMGFAAPVFGRVSDSDRSPAAPFPSGTARAPLDIPQEQCERSFTPPTGAYFNNNHINSLNSEDYDSLTVDQLFKLIRGNVGGANTGKLYSPRNSVNNDIRRRFLIITIIKKLREEKECDYLDVPIFNTHEYDMDNNLQFLSDLYLQDEKSTHMANANHAKIAPRNFTETGVVIPRDDDVVWCLQLLAYISKYPYLKEMLQNTHLVIDMSIRDKQLRLFAQRQMKSKLRPQMDIASRQTLTPRSRKGRLFPLRMTPHSSAAMSATSDTYIERFNPSPSNSPQMSTDLNIRNDNFDLGGDQLDLYDRTDDKGLTEDAEANDFEDDLDDFDEDSDHRKKDSDDEVDEYLSSFNENVTMSAQNSTYLNKLYDSIIDAESITNDLDREIALFSLSDKVNKYIEAECKSLSYTVTKKRQEQKEYLSRKWNYDTYQHFDIDDDDSKEDTDYDESLLEYKKVNLFPMVEKFTFLAGTDMYYWSGVIMRNSCRRNDFKGGVRQCGNLECGKWEKYPKEFSKCKKCKRTKYCSRECQMRAWHCHRNWCVPSNASSNSTTTVASGNTNYEVGHEVATVNAAPSDSEGLNSNSGDLSQ